VNFWDIDMTVRISQGSPEQEEIIRMLSENEAYYISLYPPESNQLLNVESLTDPHVSFFLAWDGAELCGFGALVNREGVYGEIKRMYVAPHRRGQGIGKALLQKLEEKAKELGLPHVRLETGVKQPEAIALYRAFGYQPIAPF